jgi:hypothetical protein
MKTILFAAIVGSLSVVAGAQKVDAPKLNFLADSVQQSGEVMQLRGHVRIAACSVVTADEGVLDIPGHQATVSGNVHIQLTNGVDKLSVVK